MNHTFTHPNEFKINIERQSSNPVAFLRRIKVKGHEYLYLVESYRTKSGKSRQRILQYFGPVNPIYRHPVPITPEALRKLKRTYTEIDERGKELP